jgi:hypothetical protein
MICAAGGTRQKHISLWLVIELLIFDYFSNFFIVLFFLLINLIILIMDIPLESREVGIDCQTNVPLDDDVGLSMSPLSTTILLPIQ